MNIIFKSNSPALCAKRAYDFRKNPNAKIHALKKKAGGKYEIMVEIKKH